MRIISASLLALSVGVCFTMADQSHLRVSLCCKSFWREELLLTNPTLPESTRQRRTSPAVVELLLVEEPSPCSGARSLSFWSNPMEQHLCANWGSGLSSCSSCSCSSASAHSVPPTYRRRLSFWSNPLEQHLCAIWSVI